MSLRSKIVLILGAVIGAYAVVDAVIQREAFGSLFDRLERSEAEEDVARIVEALWQEASDVHALSVDWAEWDDMYAYVDAPSERFERSNLGHTALSNAGLDLVFICDRDGRVVFRSIIDPDSGLAVELRELPDEQWLPSHPLLATTRADQSTVSNRKPYGIWQNEHKPLVVSSCQITTSEMDGEARGWVVLGRFLAQDLDDELTQRTRVDFDFWPLDGRAPLSVAPDVFDQVTSSAHAVVRPASDETLHAYVTFPDIQRNSALLLRANITRDLTLAGATSLRYALISTIVSGLLLLLVLTGLIQRTILTPLSELTEHAVWIGKNEDFRAHLTVDRSDEIGILSREFNDMMEKLELSRAELVDSARAAGMSEIATGILHNVGNVLNSVNISATVLHQKITEMGIDDLVKLSLVVNEHSDDLPGFIQNDPKGKHLQPYLSALTEHLGGQQELVLGEIDSLNGGIDHIRELIKSQQNYAIKAELIENTSISERIDEAFSITDKALATDEKLDVVRDYADIPRIMTDKHKLLEILVNVVQNARQSMDSSETPNKRLILSTQEDGEEWLDISVTDNGLGITEENLSKVFTHGFTTRQGGHGYGLHTAANAAKELGGSLTAQSKGVGYGATFTLKVPKRVAVTR
ncbi:MAG: sensor domain CHASE-containing protein/two-component sensor histidine kinase [Chlamydiales bacterium]|jgi:sensor domain CHASE-containing protein